MPTCGAGHVAVILTSLRGGSVRNTGTRGKVSGHSKRPLECGCGVMPTRRFDGIRKSRARVARMTVTGSIGQLAWAAIPRSLRGGLLSSRGNRAAARGVDCTFAKVRIWLSSIISSRPHKEAMGALTISSSSMAIAMTRRLPKIKRSQVLMTRAAQLRSRVRGQLTCTVLKPSQRG
jgi:hypothetical protein